MKISEFLSKFLFAATVLFGGIVGILAGSYIQSHTPSVPSYIQSDTPGV